MTTPPQYFMPDGLPSAPGLPFADNPEDGIYHPAGGGVGLAVNGLRAVEIDNDGNLVMVGGGSVLDDQGAPLGGGGASLTGWETDVDGNLVCTGDGAIRGNATSGLKLQGGFLDGGPTTEAEGIVLSLYSNNYDYGSEPSEHQFFRVSDWFSDAVWTDYVFRFRGVSVAFQTANAVGGTIYGSEDGDDGGITMQGDNGGAVRVEADGSVVLSHGTNGTPSVVVGGTSDRVAFFGGAGALKSEITGSVSDGTALTALLNYLETMNLLTNSATA